MFLPNSNYYVKLTLQVCSTGLCELNILIEIIKNYLLELKPNGNSLNFLQYVLATIPKFVNILQAFVEERDHKINQFFPFCSIQIMYSFNTYQILLNHLEVFFLRIPQAT